MRLGRGEFALAAGSCASMLLGRRQVSQSGGGQRCDHHPSKMSFGIDPEKLDLKLNLAGMDFARVAEATKEAMAHEKTASLLRKSSTQSLCTPVLRAADAPVEVKPPAENATVADGSRTVRGIVGAGDAHDSNSLSSSSYAQQRRDGVRYTLMDSLRDCSVNGNWTKAYKMFDTAVEKSYSMVLTASPGGDGPGTAAPPSAAGASVPLPSRTREPANEKALFEALSKINAALPPRRTSHTDRSLDAARWRNIRNMVGIMRWHGAHFYTLLKTLLAAERIEEAERVWTVMKGIGFVECQMDERTLNSLVSLLRASGQTEDMTQQLISPIVVPRKVSDVLEREKELKRRMILELEEVARGRHLHLRRANERTAVVARIAVAMHAQREGGMEEGQDDCGAQGPHDSPPTPARPLRVADFNGLLRASQSHEGTMRVLRMMKKLGMDTDAATYASIIAAHKNPRYRVEGATDAEVAAATASIEQGVVAGTKDDGGSSNSGEDMGKPTAVRAEGKRAYEAYREKRVASAMRWFQASPREGRTAHLFDEMLYLLRADSHRGEFDALLTEFRGNALRSRKDWAVVDEVNAKRDAQRRPAEGHDEAHGTHGVDVAGSTLPAIPVILPPAWTVPPTARTYELLIRRCRYRHDWQGMWELFREMQERDLRGSPKLYQMLLAETRLHPPTSVAKHGDIPSFIMDLYKDMRRHKVDVRSLDTTVTLVNAWSTTRSRRRWS